MSDIPVDPFTSRPLLSYSLYTQSQADIIRRVGNEILDISSTWANEIKDFQRAYDLFWLWVLGAYELTRTMDAFSDNFSDEMKARTKKMKISVARLRMPFAKQQLRGSNKAVHAELSVCGFDKGMIFDIEGEKFNSTEVIDKFISYIDSITFADLGVTPLAITR